MRQEIGSEARTNDGTRSSGVGLWLPTVAAGQRLAHVHLHDKASALRLSGWASARGNQVIGKVSRAVIVEAVFGHNPTRRVRGPSRGPDRRFVGSDKDSGLRSRLGRISTGMEWRRGRWRLNATRDGGVAGTISSRDGRLHGRRRASRHWLHGHRRSSRGIVLD